MPPLNLWQSHAGVFLKPFTNQIEFQRMARLLLVLSFKWCLQQMVQMAKGVLLTHRANVVHGDVSLNNFMWGPLGQVKIIDYDRAANVRCYRQMIACQAQ
jgi:serine/threonine protein kinase